MEIKDYKSFRVGNPVLADDMVTFIKEVPSKEQGAIKGYYVYGDPFVKQLKDLKPVPISENFLKHYKEYREYNEGRPFYAFIGNGHVVEYFHETGECSIDAGEGIHVDGVHELINMVKDNCGLQFARYYVPGREYEGDII